MGEEPFTGDYAGCSTTFVFLADAFTGKFLCLCDLGWGHFFRNNISSLSTEFISIGSTKIYPHMGINIVLRNTLSGGVSHTHIVLSNGISLFRCEACNYSVH
jgi:hypothetical protein